VAVLQPRVTGARVTLDERVDGLDLVVGADGALEVVEEGDRRLGVVGPQVGAVLRDPAVDALDVVDSADVL
jgi:hypothetical protein